MEKGHHHRPHVLAQLAPDFLSIASTIIHFNDFANPVYNHQSSKVLSA
jgi:hypothetical protein